MEIEILTDRAEQYWNMTFDFFLSIGFPKCEGCIPQQMEEWAGIIQAISDYSGYNVALRIVNETVQSPKPEEYEPVLQDVLTASPSCFVVTNESIARGHFDPEENLRKQ